MSAPSHDPWLYWIEKLPPHSEWGHSTKVIEIYKEMPLAMQIAMHFMPGMAVDDLPAESRYELEEVQLHALMRFHWISRADLLRRAEAAVKRFGLMKALGALAVIESGEMERLADLASKLRGSVMVPGEWSESWVISNAEDNRWRYWRVDPLPEPAGDPRSESWYCGPDWTDDVNKACHFARKEDAETWAHDDEDAWHIRRRILARREWQDRGDAEATDLDSASRATAARELCMRADRVMRAPPQIWTTGDLYPLIKEFAAFTAFFAPGFDPSKTVQPSEDQKPPSSPFCKPVDKLLPAEVLLLFRAFVISNVTQWKLGAGDHHHPIWEHVAVNAEGVEPTSGARWAYIQPANRIPLVDLEYQHQELMDARGAEEAGG